MYHEMATQPTYQLKDIVGRNIVAARETQGLTQHELATALDTSVSRVSGWERGKHTPRNLQAVADLLFDGDMAALLASPEVAA